MTLRTLFEYLLSVRRSSPRPAYVLLPPDMYEALLGSSLTLSQSLSNPRGDVMAFGVRVRPGHVELPTPVYEEVGMEALVTPAGRLWNGTVVPALCLDLDGTVRYSKTGEFINGRDDVALYPGVEERIWEYRTKGFLICGLSNQAGVAFGYKTPEQAERELDATTALFERNPFHLLKQCYHHPEGNTFPYNKRSLLRKPDIGMLALMEWEAFEEGYIVDWDQSLFVGDRPEDEECARNARITFRWADEFFGRNSRPIPPWNPEVMPI